MKQKTKKKSDMQKYNESLKKLIKKPPKAKPSGKIKTGKITRVAKN